MKIKTPKILGRFLRIQRFRKFGGPQLRAQKPQNQIRPTNTDQPHNQPTIPQHIHTDTNSHQLKNTQRNSYLQQTPVVLPKNKSILTCLPLGIYFNLILCVLLFFCIFLSTYQNENIHISTLRMGLFYSPIFPWVSYLF